MKVFLGNLSFKATEEVILQWISSTTNIPSSNFNVSVISRGARSLGYGFVECSSQEIAITVVQQINQKILEGRAINAELAKPQYPKKEKDNQNKDQGKENNQNEQQKKGKKKQRNRRGKKAQPTKNINNNTTATNKPQNTNKSNTNNGTSNNANTNNKGDNINNKRDNKKDNKANSSGKVIQDQIKQVSLLTLFVSNLPFSYAEEEVYDMFATSFGVQSVSVVRKHNMRSKGFGFVTFVDAETAKNALAAFDGKEIAGRKLIIKPAISAPEISRKVYTVKATNLPKDLDESQLSQLFAGLSISSCTISRNPDTDQSLQFGFIEFLDSTDAYSAVSILNTSTIEPSKYLKGELVEQASNPVPPKTNKNRRERPRHRNWRGKTLHGEHPPISRKRFPFPLGTFNLPREYERIIEKEEIVDVEVETEIRNLVAQETRCKPDVMKQPPQKERNARIFHNLIHAEETRMKVDIRQYDLKGVTFTEDRGLFVIQVPGLAEGRPSVLRGDVVKVRLSEQYGTAEEYIHDGYAFFVNLDNVHVSFHHDIRGYVSRGRKFDVQFTFSRTPIRLYHRALAISPEIWQKLWTPKRPTKLQLPLSKFYGPITLNQEQSSAVQTILHNNESPLVLHGPPGTGKTATLVEAILQIVNRSSQSRILVCAPSNSAVDLISHLIHSALGAEKSKACMFRLNGFMRPPKKVDPQSLLEICLYDKGSFDLPEIEILVNYNIILSTCVASGYLESLGISIKHFTHIFIDEAGEAIEPETLIPIKIANPLTSVVFAGDHLQLGPIVRSSTAVEWRYDRSLMEHLLDHSSDKLVCKLLRSYRAHPELMKLYSKLFYEDRLINCTNLEDASSLLKWTELPNPKIPLMFIHSDEEEAREPDSPSWYNFREKETVVQLIQTLLEDRTLELKPDDIGVITPYRKQVQKINNLAHFQAIPKGYKVGTVENFQGQERRVIILSLVRSRAVNLAHDSKFKLGFCDNPKRLNVAISRAKQLLIIVGNGTLFGTYDPYWDKLLHHFKANNLFKGQVPTWVYKPNNFKTEIIPSFENTNEDQGWRQDD